MRRRICYDHMCQYMYYLFHEVDQCSFRKENWDNVPHIGLFFLNAS